MSQRLIVFLLISYSGKSKLPQTFGSPMMPAANANVYFQMR
jgi:hypothetical protein